MRHRWETARWLVILAASSTDDVNLRCGGQLLSSNFVYLEHLECGLQPHVTTETLLKSATTLRDVGRLLAGWDDRPVLRR